MTKRRQYPSDETVPRRRVSLALRPGGIMIAFALSVVDSTMSASAQPEIGSTPDESGSGIEEIVVTAQKRAEKVQNVPISISVLTASDIQKQGLQSIDDLGSKIPNVQVLLPFGPAEPQFSIRGVTETDYSPNQSSPIAMYVDGVFKSVGALQAQQTLDLDRVEVLRGPQGTLQGRNSTGGAVQFYTKAPTFDYGGYVMAGVGNYGRYETEEAVQAPIVDDKLAFRAAFTFTNVDGYIRNLIPNAPYGGNLNGIFDWAGRLSFLFRPSDDFQAVLRLNASRSDPVNYGVYAKDIGPGGIGIPPGVVPGVETSGYTRAGLGFFDNQTEDVHRREIKNRSLALEINYDLTDTLKITSITGYDIGQWNSLENDAGTPIPVEDAVYFSRIHSTQQEARITSSFSGPDNFIFGVLYDQESEYIATQNNVTLYQPSVVSVDGQQENICINTQFYTCIQSQQWNQKRVDYASYFNNTYNITDSLVFSAGVRYTADWIGVQGFRTGYTYLAPTSGRPVLPEINLIPGVQNDPTAVAPNQTTSDHKWIGHAGLDYHIDTDNMVYGSFSRGFRGSAYNAGAFTSITSINAVKPETLNSFEIGTKNEFLDRRLQVNLAAFYYIYRNQQFASIDPTTGFSVEYNLPKVNSEGFELDVTAKPIDDVTVHFGSGYTYAIYQSGLVNAQDVTGYRVEVAPRWSFSASVDWRILKEDWGQLDLYVDGNGVTKQFFAANDSLGSQENGYSIYNARLTAETPDHNESVSFWVQNLLDRKYFTSIIDNQAPLNYSFAERGYPRAFGAQATYKF